MYIKIVLTLLLIATAAVAVFLARPPAAAPQAQTAPPYYQAEAALSQEIGEEHFDNVEVGRILQDLEARTGIRIAVDWPALAAAKRSIRPEQKISITRKRGTLQQALDGIFVPGGRTGGNFTPLTYNATGMVLTVSTDTAIPAGQRSLRIYEIGDLLSDQYWGWKPPAGEEANTREVRLSSLAWLIHANIGAETQLDSASRYYYYQAYGSAVPEITAVGDRLVALQTTEKHREIETLLAWLRQGRH